MYESIPKAVIQHDIVAAISTDTALQHAIIALQTDRCHDAKAMRHDVESLTEFRTN